MKFLENISNWDNHRPLLWLALENTSGPVLELGMGDGSTPYLHEYCKEKKRVLFSFENNLEYSNKFKYLNSELHSLSFITDWSLPIDHKNDWGVAFIDQAPAEQRHIDAIRLANSAQIVVVHDAEHEGKDCDVYCINKIIPHYKYRLDFSIPTHPAKTIMLSNFIDVSKLQIPEFTNI